MRRLPHVVFAPGIVLVVLIVGVAHSHLTSPQYRFGSQNSLAAYLALVAVHLLAAHATGLPDETRDVQPAAAAAVLASGTATAIWLLAQTIHPGLLPRWVVLVCAFAVPTYTFALGWISVVSRRRQGQRDRVLAFASADDAARLRVDVERSFPMREREFVPVRIVEIDSMVTEAAQLADLDRDDVTVVVLSDAATQRDDVYHVAESLHRNGARARTLTDFYAAYFGKLPVAELGRMALLFDVRDQHNPTYRNLKRALDLLGAVLGFAATVVAVPFVAAANLVANRGPLLFRQQRIGRDGRPFTIYKFRTMRPGEADATTSWTRPDDPRVTRFGRVLRRTHLDELPQSWNILRGDLSLVGPRPEQPHYVEELTAKEPAFALRHLVTPGLTGWAQVKYRYAATEAASLEKLQYDLYYVRFQSLSLDLRILSRTIRSVVRHRGR